MHKCYQIEKKIIKTNLEYLFEDNWSHESYIFITEYTCFHILCYHELFNSGIHAYNMYLNNFEERRDIKLYTNNSHHKARYLK